MSDEARPIGVHEPVRPTDEAVRLIRAWAASQPCAPGAEPPPLVIPTLGVVTAVVAEEPLRVLRVMWTTAPESDWYASGLRRL